jgi:hypothetical protein
MSAYNFQDQFAPDILVGEKRSTIRQRARCKAGAVGVEFAVPDEPARNFLHAERQAIVEGAP